MTESTKELTVKPSQEVLAVGSQIDKIVEECMPLAEQENQNFVQALTLANGIKALREIFRKDPNIKATVEAMQNTHLGFMTDRTPQAIERANQDGKRLRPYTYEEVSEVCIEAMLKGYRISGNEFNMLVSRFYPAKDGKFRKIQEHPGVTDFQFTTTSPLYEPPVNNVQYAKVQAFASWKKNGNLATLGSSGDKQEDKLIFKIRVNRAMGEDAIVGKALSKLFSRVLMRITGKILPESTDIMEGDDVIDADAKEVPPEVKEAKPGTAQELYGPKNGQEEANQEPGQDEPEKEEDNPSPKDELPENVKIGQEFANLTGMLLSKFTGLHDKGVNKFLELHRTAIPTWPEHIVNIIKDKCAKKEEWAKLLEGILKEKTEDPGSNSKPFSYICDEKKNTRSKYAGKSIMPMVTCSGCKLAPECEQYQDYLDEQRGGEGKQQGGEVLE